MQALTLELWHIYKGCLKEILDINTKAKVEWYMNGNFSRYIVRFIVVAYLIYLGVKLISDVINATEPADNPALFIAFGAAFIIIAVVLGVFTIIKMKNEPSTSNESTEPIEDEADKEVEALDENEAANAKDTEKAMIMEEEEEDFEDDL